MARVDDAECIAPRTPPPPGEPKGVLLTHANVVGVVAGLIAYLKMDPTINMGPEHSFLSYLPLAHIFDRWGTSLAWWGAHL